MNARAMPHSLEAERALLGGLMERPAALDESPELMSLQPDHFYSHDHKHLYSLFMRMRREGEPIDMVTVPMRVSRATEPDHFGGIMYVTDLPHHAPATANLGHYAKQVQADYTRRQLLKICYELQDQAFAGEDDPQVVVAKARALLDSVGASTGKGQWRHSFEAALDVLEELDRVMAAGAPEGTLTGFPTLDNDLVCMGNGELIILAARPSMGKTALAMNITQRVAEAGGAVGFISLEMSDSSLLRRLVSGQSRVGVKDIRMGKVTGNQLSEIIDAAQSYDGMPIYIDDRGGLSIEDITVSCHQLRNELARKGQDLRLIVVDYLQLIEARGYTAGQSVQKYTHISKTLKKLARNLDVPVLALSQLSRACENRDNRWPVLSDLRESGGIEQDADAVIAIYRDEYYNPESLDRGLAELIIRKARNADAGKVVPMGFDAQRTEFVEKEAHFIKEWRRQRGYT